MVIQSPSSIRTRNTSQFGALTMLSLTTSRPCDLGGEAVEHTRQVGAGRVHTVGRRLRQRASRGDVPVAERAERLALAGVGVRSYPS
jgi:hypothetical protein